MSKPSTPHERLRRARLQAGFDTAADAARTYGWSADTYKSHENGIRGLRNNAVGKYARAFRVDPEWISFGRSPPRWLEQNVTMERVALKPCPEITWLSVVPWVNSRAMGGAGVMVVSERVIDVNLNSGAGAFWLRLTDDSMASKAPGPSFATGHLVAFDPDAKINPGDFVLAKPDGTDDLVYRKAQLRGVSAKGGAIYDLIPLNPDFPSYQISGNSDGKVIARAISYTVAL